MISCLGLGAVQAQVVRAQEPQMEPRQEARLLIYPYLPLRRQPAGKHDSISQCTILHTVVKNHTLQERSQACLRRRWLTTAVATDTDTDAVAAWPQLFIAVACASHSFLSILSL